MNKYVLAAISFLIMLFFYGCEKSIGYGLFLWEKPSSPYKTGEIINVIGKSDIQKTYLVRDKNNDLIEIPFYRLIFFEEKSQMDDFYNKFKKNINLYAFSKKNNLPVRKEPNQTATLIYNLKTNQVVKIIDVASKEEKIGSYVNYWYHVITEDGCIGYCYGEFLQLFEEEENPYDTVKEFETYDPDLEIIFNNVWRPEYFEEMISQNRYDLRKFSVDYGLFPAKENNCIKINLYEHWGIFQYSEITKLGKGSYAFKGAPLYLEINEWKVLKARYTIMGQEHVLILKQIVQDIGAIVYSEMKRRDVLYETFCDKTFSSIAYGTISFDSSQMFNWQGYDKLVPQIIPEESKESGRIDFIYYLSNTLKYKYDGVLTLTFSASPITKDAPYEEGVNFLFIIMDDGIQFVYINKSNIQNLLALKADISPLVIYFTIQN